MGIIEIDDIKKLVNDNTILINIPHSNGELGTINNTKEIGDFCKSKNILYYCNIEHIFGRNKINLNTSNINFISLSFDKLNGPSDIGILFIKKKSIANAEKIINSSNYYLLNIKKSIPVILGSLASLLDISKNRDEKNKKIQDLKNKFISSLNTILPIINYIDYLSMYNQSIIKLSIIMFKPKLNSQAIKNIICFSIFSIKKRICIKKIKKYLSDNNIILSNISESILDNIKMDSVIKRGLISISIDDFIKVSDISKLIKNLVDAISIQYPTIYDEIKDNIITKKILESKKNKKVVRFSSPIFHILTIKKKINIENRKIKGILIK